MPPLNRYLGNALRMGLHRYLQSSPMIGLNDRVKYLYSALKRPLKYSNPEILGAFSIEYSSECRARARNSVSRTFSIDLYIELLISIFYG